MIKGLGIEPPRPALAGASRHNWTLTLDGEPVAAVHDRSMVERITTLLDRERWHPASEPPSDDRRVLAVCAGWMAMARYDGHYWRDDEGCTYEPTHWRELPE